MVKYKPSEIRGNVSLSYVDTEKGFQLNVQSIEDIFEHISPEFILLRTYNIRGNDDVVELYANKEALKYIGNNC